MNATWNQMAFLTLFLQLFAAIRKRFRPWHKFFEFFLWNIISGILFQLFHQELKILKRIQPIGFRCLCNRIQDCTCLCSFLGIYDMPTVFSHAEFFDTALSVIIIQWDNRWFQKNAKIFFLVHRIGPCLFQISWGYDLNYFFLLYGKTFHEQSKLLFCQLPGLAFIPWSLVGAVSGKAFITQ